MIRVFRHYVPKSLILYGTVEGALFFASVYVGTAVKWVGFNPTDKLMVGEVWTKAAGFAAVMLVAMAAMGLYQRHLRDDLRGVLFRAILAMFLVLCLTMILVGLFPEYSVGSPAFTVAFVTSMVSVLLFRTVVYRFASDDIFRRRVLILGAGPFAAQVEELRRKVDRLDLTIVGFVAVDSEPVAVSEDKVLSYEGDLLQLARDQEVDEIVVAIAHNGVGLEESEAGTVPVSQILDCKMNGVRIYDLLTFFEQQTGKIKLDALNTRGLIFAEGFIQAVLKGYLHRLFDVVVSLLLLLIAWPLMVVTAALIWLESGGNGPVLYRQLRVGRDGRVFEVMKFRSMQVDAEDSGQAQWAQTNDSRVTRVGGVIRNLRIDELPQLINVLAGDMSFVGPRPERPEFVAELRRTIPYYDLRHRVNPGITGWAQICYPYGSSEKDAKEKLQFDLYYIKNYSLFLDLMILIQTAQVILWGKGAR